MSIRRGFLLGKFMPPHSGHQLLCDTAKALVDELTILVCWLPDDPIPGPLRLGWMQQLYPDCRVIGHGAVVPQQPEDHADFWAIWQKICREAHPEPIDLVFASEDYGNRLAQELGAAFRPVDLDRVSAPVSGTAVRQNPYDQWAQLPPSVRGHYAYTVCLHGVESVGKSVMVQQLARHFGTNFVAEYGRSYCEQFGNDLDDSDFLAIAQTHDAMVNSQKTRSNRLLIVDTDPLMTRAWSLMMQGHAHPWFDSWQSLANHYLLLEPDLPWVDDGTRIFGDPAERARFHALAKEELDRRGVLYTVISGTGEARLASAIEAIESRLGAQGIRLT